MITHAVVDGRPARGSDIGLALAARAGHFTAMQVRGGRVRGLAEHLRRLERATRELFGLQPDRDLVLASLRAAVSEAADASVRVHVARTDALHVIVDAGPPVDAPASPRRLKTVAYQRFLPHVKHGGGFPQAHLARLAQAEGFDDVLLIGADGLISETSIANLGCFDGERIVWPDAPMLEGITMRLLSRGPHGRRPLRVADLPAFPAVFVCNSWGVSPVGGVDELELKTDEAAYARVVSRYEDTPWDPIG
ncbi:aminotransferase class IV [Thermoactinospora rubra]|uniref:aminotransferase class IV n=1 Tax=Thermoactinospora rubra TaxID=1088767 RepID=UPI000A106EF0|nr:aminotransferase class IV [Thermoactinospora rubra]